MNCRAICDTPGFFVSIAAKKIAAIRHKMLLKRRSMEHLYSPMRLRRIRLVIPLVKAHFGATRGGTPGVTLRSPRAVFWHAFCVLAVCAPMVRFLFLYGLQECLYAVQFCNFMVEQIFFVQFLGFVAETQEMKILCGSERLHYFLVFSWEP